MNLFRHTLRSSNLDVLVSFYNDMLGMNVLAQPSIRGENVHALLGYHNHPAAGTCIELQSCDITDQHKHYHHKTHDIYWKIGITLPDVDSAVSVLRRKGVSVSDPQQFLDIGYLCHLQDPAGFQIELLQHEFHSVSAPKTPIPDHPLGQCATLGQITLRVIDINESLLFYRDIIGMRLLSIQPVTPYGFTLYFLAHTDETPPNADIESVANREWLWQRPYTTIELQHVWGYDKNHILKLPVNGYPGFGGLTFVTSDIQTTKSILSDKNYPVESTNDNSGIITFDPQGVRISILG